MQCARSGVAEERSKDLQKQRRCHLAILRLAAVAEGGFVPECM